MLTWNSLTASWLNWYGARPEPVRPSACPKKVLLLSRAVHDEAVQRSALTGEDDVADPEVVPDDAGRR